MEKKSNSFGVTFFVKKYKMVKGNVPIYVRITVNSKRADISTKRVIAEKNWNALKGQAKGSKEETLTLNNYLQQVRSAIVHDYQQMLLNKKLITAETLKLSFLGGKNEHSLNTLMEYHNTQMKSVLANGTLKNYFTTQGYIKEFLKRYYNASDIHLADLNYRFISEFEMFLRKRQPRDHQKKLQTNGVMKHLERLRKAVRLAVKMEWIAKDPFENYRLKFDKTERGFLTVEELEKIENKVLPLDRLEWVRDLFVFSCYTGLAYCDTMSLSAFNIVRGIDGEDWIISTRQKTGETIKVPLLPKATKLMEKYKDHPRSATSGTIFPNISNQKVNAYLKEIGGLCGVTKDLTFHLARHTFATTVTLSNGVPIESVSKMLGHTKITTTQIYAKVVERKLGDDMRMLKQKLSVSEMQRKQTNASS